MGSGSFSKSISSIYGTRSLDRRLTKPRAVTGAASGVFMNDHGLEGDTFLRAEQEDRPKPKKKISLAPVSILK